MFRRMILSLAAAAALAVPAVPAVAAHITKHHHLLAAKHHTTIMLSATKVKSSRLATATKRHTLHTGKTTAKRLHARRSSVKTLISLSGHTAKHKTAIHHKAKTLTTKRHVVVDPLA